MGILAWIQGRNERAARKEDYTGGTKEMGIFAQLRSGVSSTFRAKWLYRRGMRRAKLHKNEAAIDDYTAVIEMENAPASVRAMALYNRALVYKSLGRESEAIDDLSQVTGMAGVAERVRTEAKRQLVRMKRTHERDDESSSHGRSV